METITRSVPAESGGAAIPPLLDVLILYEDFGTGLRAKRSLDLLPHQLTADAKWNTKLWRIQLLSDSLLAEQAAREAAAADVIILSVHGRTPLPPEVRTWITAWLRHKERRSYALGVLLDAEEVSRGSQNPVVNYMQQVATIGGVDLFYGFSEAPRSELDSATEEINQRANYSSAILQDMLKRAEPHQWWGINE